MLQICGCGVRGAPADEMRFERLELREVSLFRN